MNPPILEKIRTESERNKLIEEIDLLLSAIYQNKGQGLEIILKSKVRFWVADFLTSEFSKQDIDIQKYLVALKNSLEKFKALKLTLAFEPTNATLDNLFYFVKKQIGEDVILDLNFDESIMGGCVLIYEGRYKNFSIRGIFDSEFLKIKDELFKMIAQKV